MIKLEFTDEDKKLLSYWRFNHLHPRVQLKMEVLWLKSQKLSNQKIAKLAGISANTVTKYIRDYQEAGIEKLKEIKFNRPESELKKHQKTIEEYFELNPPATINEAVKRIEELTGIKRSPTQVRKFLKSIGMKCLKVGTIPSKADVEVQDSYREEELEPRLEEAKAGKRAVFFVDASHFVMGAFVNFVWCFKRIFIKSPSGRKRFNVLGALNAITHEVIMITNDSYITGTQVCELLEKISELGLLIPITLVLDNARYQKCAIVKEMAELLGIELLYLPPYSPNLNLIERLWKFVKKKCLYAKYYEDFTEFSSAIEGCIKDANVKYKKELDSLLTLRFQRFDKSQIMNA